MIEIIPAIDIMNRVCVRLTRGDYSTGVVYEKDPVKVARRFQQAGIRHIHVVDLDGARTGSPRNLDVLAAISENTGLQIDFGGGIRTTKALKAAIRYGANQVTVGSVAVKEPDLVAQWVGDVGAERLILGADSLNNRVATSGWQSIDGPEVFDFIDKFNKMGINTVIATDISRDGMLEGPAFELYRSIRQRFPGLYLIASGGVSSIEHVSRLDDLGINGVIIGKAIYEGLISLQDLRGFLC